MITVSELTLKPTSTLDGKLRLNISAGKKR
jgi:hypothetical protein